MKSILLILIASFCFLYPQESQEVVELSDNTVLRITGANLTKTTTEIEVTMGIKANEVRIYSEPSRVLLVSIMDQSWDALDESTRRELGWEPALPYGGALGEMGPGMNVRMGIRSRPPGDHVVSVWVHRLWEDTNKEEGRVVAVGHVGNGDFGFETKLSSNYPKITFTNCCISYECGWSNNRQCKDCTSVFFTCCQSGQPECCWAKCGRHTCRCDCQWNGCFIIKDTDIGDEPPEPLKH